MMNSEGRPTPIEIINTPLTINPAETDCSDVASNDEEQLNGIVESITEDSERYAEARTKDVNRNAVQGLNSSVVLYKEEPSTAKVSRTDDGTLKSTVF
jgi:hypothetical protein